MRRSFGTMNAEFKAKVEPEFNRALDLWHSGETQAALNILHGLAASHPDQPAILGMTGGIYFDGKDYEHAREYYRETVLLSPKSEMASLCLFHSLWQIGEREAAFAEMRRFLSLSNSEEYESLISDMSEELNGHDGADL